VGLKGGLLVKYLKSLFKREKNTTPRFLKETKPNPKLWNELAKELNRTKAPEA
jgi:hypothetical protein